MKLAPAIAYDRSSSASETASSETRVEARRRPEPGRATSRTTEEAARRDDSAPQGPPPRRRRGRPVARQGRFGEWLLKAGADRYAVAEELEISRRHLDNLAREDRRPSLALAIKIEQLTRGEVTAAFLSSIKRHH